MDVGMVVHAESRGGTFGLDFVHLHTNLVHADFWPIALGKFLREPNANPIQSEIWEFPKLRGTLFWGPFKKNPTKKDTISETPT